MTVWDADNLNAPHTLRELAQDGEPAPGSTTATCPSAGVSEPLLPCPFCGGPARHSIIPDDAAYDAGGEFIYCFCCASSTGVSFRSRQELFALWNRRQASPSAGGFGAANDHSADERIGRLMNENLFLQAQLDAYREMAEARKPVDLKGRMLEAKAGRERRAKESKANLSEALTAIAAERATWPHAGSTQHAAARMACDAIAQRVKKLMGVA